MTSVGPGVREIRVHAEGEFRLLFVSHFTDAIYVLHAFQKRSRKTSRNDLAIARARLRQIVRR
jgi:phage-related protein